MGGPAGAALPALHLGGTRRHQPARPWPGGHHRPLPGEQQGGRHASGAPQACGAAQPMHACLAMPGISPALSVQVLQVSQFCFPPPPAQHRVPSPCHPQADFILAHGTEALGTSTDGSAAEPCSLEHMKQLLGECAAAAAARGAEPPPMVVANPDVVTVAGSELRWGTEGQGGGWGVVAWSGTAELWCSAGALHLEPVPSLPRLTLLLLPPTLPPRVMPGTLARHYASQCGGRVVLMGKPAPVIYREALAMLGLPAEATLAVGDSLEHDIGGAQAAGVDSVFVLGGIHAGDVGLQGGAGAGAGGHSFSEQGLAAACAEHGVALPTFVLPFFSWQ